MLVSGSDMENIDNIFFSCLLRPLFEKSKQSSKLKGDFFVMQINDVTYFRFLFVIFPCFRNYVKGQ